MIVEQRHDRAGDGTMPAAVRRSLLTVLAAVILGAVYLIAVRGEALLTDLSALGTMLLCF